MKFIIQSATVFTAVFLLSMTAYGQEAEISLGSQLPLADRAMPSSNGGTQRLADIGGQNGTVVVFWSNNCPWVDKYEDRLLESISRFSGEGYGFALVNPNDPVAFPEESIDGIRKRASDNDYGVPYLLDEGSALAKALGATRTPHVFVFDGSGALVYEGGIDDSPGDPGNVTEAFLSDVLTAVAAGNRASVSRTTSFGCRIKYVQ